MTDLIPNAIEFASKMEIWEILGLIFGLLAVYFLIKENILTWPFGILYCFISFYIFWNSQLYQDFGLTFFFLIMNIYGWKEWTRTKENEYEKLPITKTKVSTLIILLIITALYVGVTGYVFSKYTDAFLPYWDATTTGLSLSAMWMTAKKKLENWIIWLIVDILATGIYLKKGLEFYAILYCVYIVMAGLGWINWKKLYNKQQIKTL